VKRSAFRLAAGTLALALPLAAVAACGAEKKKTVSQEFAAAQAFLGDSKAASFTLRLADDKGSLKKLVTAENEDMPAVVVDALLGGSITYVTDAAGDATLKSVQAEAANPTDLKASLKKVNMAFVIKDAKAELVELRLVAGNLYAHVNLVEVGRLAEASGVEDFDAMLDESLGSMDRRFGKGLADVRAGKWLKLPLADYLDQLQDLAGSVVPGGVPTAAPEGYDASALGKKAYEAVKPFVKVTDANDSSADRVLDVKVQARPALKALLGVLKAEKDLPFAGLLGDVLPSSIDEHIAEGEATGTIRLKDSHLTQVAVDLESLRLLAKDPGKDSLAGVRIVLDVDDAAAEVTAPTDLAALDLGSILEEFLDAFSGQASVSSTTGFGF
jgi:hypothetical protein